MMTTLTTDVPATDEAMIKAGHARSGMTFHQRVWALCSRIPAGQVSTYGDMAQALGQPRAARAVGQALHHNPYAPTVPCHRVVGAKGDLTGFAGGLPKKQSLLKSEGVPMRGGKVVLTDCRAHLVLR